MRLSTLSSIMAVIIGFAAAAPSQQDSANFSPAYNAMFPRSEVSARSPKKGGDVGYTTVIFPFINGNHVAMQN